MKSTYINSQCYYQGNNGVLLPAVTTVLKATQTQESRNGLYYWRKKVGDAEANRIANHSRIRGNALHKMIQHHFQTQSQQPINNFIQPYWNSIQPLLKHISDVQLVEQVVPNYVERYIGLNQLAVSAITQAELYYGAINNVELKKIKKHLQLLLMFPVDIMVSNQFIELMETYSLSHKLSIPDALIASTALVHKIDLYTLNIKDFRFIHGLNLYQSSMNKNQ